jgi:pyruvate kinase
MSSSAQNSRGSYALAAMDFRRSKIVCTLGPASNSAEMIDRLMRAGDVVGIVAGTPLGIRGTTNFMKLHVVGGTSGR